MPVSAACLVRLLPVGCFTNVRVVIHCHELGSYSSPPVPGRLPSLCDGSGVLMLSLVAGPIPAGEYTTLPVALQPSSFTIYLGANRGRGHLVTFIARPLLVPDKARLGFRFP